MQPLDCLSFELYPCHLHLLLISVTLPLHLLFFGLNSSIMICTNGSNAFRTGQVSTLASGENLVAFRFFSILLGMKHLIHLLQGQVLNYEQCCISLFCLFTILDNLLC